MTLLNKSTAAVSGITATVAGGDLKLFTVDDAPAALGPGDSATVDISYSPLALETRSLATVTFEGSDKEKATLNLFGEPVGVALTVAPNPIDFGYVPLGVARGGLHHGLESGQRDRQHHGRHELQHREQCLRGRHHRRLHPSEPPDLPGHAHRHRRRRERQGLLQPHAADHPAVCQPRRRS